MTHSERRATQGGPSGTPGRGGPWRTYPEVAVPGESASLPTSLAEIPLILLIITELMIITLTLILLVMMIPMVMVMIDTTIVQSRKWIAWTHRKEKHA